MHYRESFTRQKDAHLSLPLPPYVKFRQPVSLFLPPLSPYIMKFSQSVSLCVSPLSLSLLL